MKYVAFELIIYFVETHCLKKCVLHTIHCRHSQGLLTNYYLYNGNPVKHCLVHIKKESSQQTVWYSSLPWYTCYTIFSNYIIFLKYYCCDFSTSSPQNRMYTHIYNVYLSSLMPTIYEIEKCGNRRECFFKKSFSNVFLLFTLLDWNAKVVCNSIKKFFFASEGGEWYVARWANINMTLQNRIWKENWKWSRLRIEAVEVGYWWVTI